MASDPIIRDALEGDVEAIQAIYAENVLNSVASYEIKPPSVGEMKKRFQAIREAGYPFLVAEAEDEIAGYAYASRYNPREAYEWLVEDSIYLAPQARGKGIGSALLGELIRQCEALGFRQMIAIIGGSTSASVALHEKAGFEIAGTIKASGFKHGKWRDTIIMQRELGEGDSSAPE